MFTVRLPHEGEDISALETFDNTKLSAINTCPTWGIVRYGLHKTMSAAGRAMALEAGSACHDVFAAVRLYDLMMHGPKVYGEGFDCFNKAMSRAHQLFDEIVFDEKDTSRTTTMLEHFLDSTEDERTRVLRGCLHILETSGFYDDPYDKRRTMDKLTEACIAYIDRYDFGKSVPYVNGEFVGIENAFDLVVEYTSHDDGHHVITRKVRFTGRIDGTHCFKNDITSPYLEENKTASRLGDAWEASFEMAHQVTGYCIALSALINQDVRMAKVRGLAIPQPRLIDGSGLSNITVLREDHHVRRWTEWFVHTVETYFKWKETPLDAPRYTHSCNRYFRPCAFIPLCAADDEEAHEILSQMPVEEWSPLHEKSGD